MVSWGSSPQGSEPWSLAQRGLLDRTVRELVFTSIGGRSLRVRLTNVFGDRPVLIGQAAIGLSSGGSTLLLGSGRPLLFHGRPTVVVPAGGNVLSDPVRLRVSALQTLAVSVFLPEATGSVTEHADAQEVSYLATGDHVDDPRGTAFRQRTESWYLLDDVEVAASPSAADVIAFGDSITDGVGSPVGANARWPNDLARRLGSLPEANLGVVDEGIGGNRILHASPGYGVDALSRFRRDVLDQPGARVVILLEGVNDIGFSRSLSELSVPHVSVSAKQIIDGYLQLIAEAHAAGIRILGGTLTPFRGARYWSPAGEAEREAINRWIRRSGAFDGVVDFAHTLADPTDPETLNPAYDSGDHLHPNAAGYRAMADAINLRMLILDSKR